MATPTLKYVTPTTPEADLAFAPEPVEIYDLPAGGGEVAWDDVTGKPAVIASGADQAAARTSIGAAALASPALTGTPTAPTASVTTNTTQLATTAFVRTSAGAAKTQIAALATVTAANAAPSVAEPTKAEFDVLVTLANANKVAINAIIAALKA